MFLAPELTEQIRKAVYRIEPDAKIYLYGSYARGDFHAESDVDLLVLLNKKKISYKDVKAVRYSLYDVEFEVGKIMSAMVYAESDWESTRANTSFYNNIKKDGVPL